MEKQSVFIRLYTVLVCLFLITPVFIVVVLAFNAGSQLSFPPSDYSLRWFRDFLFSADWRQSITLSLSIALASSILSTIVSFMAAYAFVRESFRFKKTFLALMLLPTIAPTVVTAIAMYFMTIKLGFVGNIVWIAFCHSVISIPIVLLILIAAIRGIEENYERAALGLGASRFYMFRHIVLPLSWPSIVSALLFSFLSSFDELIISLFLTGVRSQPLPVRIWNSLHLEVEPVIAAVSTLFIGLTFIILTINYFLQRRTAESRL